MTTEVATLPRLVTPDVRAPDSPWLRNLSKSSTPIVIGYDRDELLSMIVNVNARYHL